jgi:quercetin dioxygenase-like cupin family protein
MEVLSPAGVPGPAGYAEHFRSADLSVGTYTLPAGATDPQSPHTEDEIYVVTAGRATFWTPARTAEVAPGTVLFVPAGEPHRFTAITEALTTLVIFGPAEDTRA